MASKQTMIEEMCATYTEYSGVLNFFDIKFLKWIDSIKSYNDARKAYAFIYKKFHLCLKEAQKIWLCHKPETWFLLSKINRTCDEMQRLLGEKRDMKIIWKARPKFRSKSK